MFNLLINYCPQIVSIARAYEAMGLKCKFYSNESIFDLFSDFRPSVVIVLAQNINRAFVKVCQENPWVKVVLLGQAENEFIHQLANSGIKLGRVSGLRPCVDIIQFNGACGKPYLKCKYLICESNGPEIQRVYHENKLSEAISIRMFGKGWGGYGGCGLLSDGLLRDQLASSDIFITTKPDLVLAAIVCASRVVYDKPLYNLKNIYHSVEKAELFGYNNEDVNTIIGAHTSFHVGNEILREIGFDLSHRIPRFECNNA